MSAADATMPRFARLTASSDDVGAKRQTINAQTSLEAHFQADHKRPARPNHEREDKSQADAMCTYKRNHWVPVSLISAQSRSGPLRTPHPGSHLPNLDRCACFVARMQRVTTLFCTLATAETLDKKQKWRICPCLGPLPQTAHSRLSAPT